MGGAIESATGGNEHEETHWKELALCMALTGCGFVRNQTRHAGLELNGHKVPQYGGDERPLFLSRYRRP